jgi:hypothetical protein
MLLMGIQDAPFRHRISLSDVSRLAAKPHPLLRVPRQRLIHGAPSLPGQRGKSLAHEGELHHRFHETQPHEVHLTYSLHSHGPPPSVIAVTGVGFTKGNRPFVYHSVNSFFSATESKIRSEPALRSVGVESRFQPRNAFAPLCNGFLTGLTRPARACFPAPAREKCACPRRSFQTDRWCAR